MSTLKIKYPGKKSFFFASFGYLASEAFPFYFAGASVFFLTGLEAYFFLGSYAFLGLGGAFGLAAFLMGCFFFFPDYL